MCVCVCFIWRLPKGDNSKLGIIYRDCGHQHYMKLDDLALFKAQLGQPFLGILLLFLIFALLLCLIVALLFREAAYRTLVIVL